MAIAFSNGQTGVDTTLGTVSSAALGVTAVAGQLIVCSVADDSATTTSQGVPTDNFGNTYARIGSIQTNSLSLGLYYSAITTGGASLVVSDTWNTGVGAKCTIVVQYFNGFTGVPTLDQSNTAATGSGTVATSGTTGTTTNANELVVIGAGHDSTTSVFTLGALYSNLTTLNSANAVIGQESKVISITGTQNGTMNIAATRNWAAAIATFYDNTTPPTAHNLMMMGVGS